MCQNIQQAEKYVVHHLSMGKKQVQSLLKVLNAKLTSHLGARNAPVKPTK